MYLTATLKRTLALTGVAMLAVVGLIGWTRKAAEPTLTTPAPANYLTRQLGNPEPVSRDPNARVVYGPSPFGETPARPASQAYVGPETAPPAYVTPAYTPPRVTRSRVAPQRRSYRTTSRVRRRHVVVRKRPFSHSAAIVGGSAAGGALIGALAGGGKGAAIGALAGGGGGLVYDRATHKQKLVSDR